MPTSFGRYRVVRPLGEGAMAAVFEVEDTGLGVRRALKVLHPEVAANPDLRARFDAEARTLAQLRHPHLVAVHDVGESEGRPWLVMDLAQGGSLADRVTREGALDPRVVLGAMLGVLDALAVVHAAGVIHRDVKPQNLLYDGAGALRLADFGIALTEGLELTRTGMVLGSWGFMAPEQRLDPRKVRPATDLFGLGASAVWAIVGGPVSDLHVGEHRAVLLRDVSDDVSGVLHRALAFRPEERFRSAGEMRAAVVEVLGAEEGGGGGRAEGLTQRHGDSEERQQEGGGVAGGGAGGARTGGRVSGIARRDSWGGEGLAPRKRIGGWRIASLAFVGVGLTAAAALLGRSTVAGAPVREADLALLRTSVGDFPWCENAIDGFAGPSVLGPRETQAISVDDLDGDGRLDAIFTNQLDESVTVWWGDPDGMPTLRMDLPSGRSAKPASVFDADGDGMRDLVTVVDERGELAILRSLGHRTFAPPVHLLQSPVPVAMLLLPSTHDGADRGKVLSMLTPDFLLRRSITGGLTWPNHDGLSFLGPTDGVGAVFLRRGSETWYVRGSPPTATLLDVLGLPVREIMLPNWPVVHQVFAAALPEH